MRYLRTSAYKVREVLALIRGLEVDEARHVLRFCDRAAAKDVLKVLESAVANAEHTLHIPADELFVSVAYADEGPTIKRWRPRARGRATRIRKRTSHTTVIVARLSDEQLQARRRREATVAGGRRRGVLPGRRRKAEEKAAPAARGPEKPVAATGEPEVEEEIVETVESEAAAAPLESFEGAPIEEAEEEAEGETVPDTDDEERAARYATLGRQEEPVAAEETTGDAEPEGESSPGEEEEK